MSLPSLQLTEPIATAMTALLSSKMPAVVTAFNATLAGGDAWPVDQPVQYLPYMPVPSLLQGGMPIIGFQRLGGTFTDDLQMNTDAEHEFAVMAVVQNADHESLVHQLERTLECVAYTIQQDRLAGTPPGTASALKLQAGVWSINFERYEPGPLLGDIVIDDQGNIAPPRSFISYAGLVMRATRTEI